MILENLGIAHVAAQGINRMVAAYVHHFENGCAALCGRCEEASPQRVTGE
jgi:hypothetical protein